MKLVLFLCSWIVIHGAVPAQAENSAAFTDYASVVEAIFPPTKMMQSNRRPNAVEKDFFDQARAHFVEMAEASGPAWANALDPAGLVAEKQRKKIFSILRQVPLWVCNPERAADQMACSLCQGGDRSACVVSRKSTVGWVSVLVVHPGELVQKGFSEKKLGKLFAEVTQLEWFGKEKVSGNRDGRLRAAKSVDLVSETEGLFRAIDKACQVKHDGYIDLDFSLWRKLFRRKWVVVASTPFRSCVQGFLTQVRERSSAQKCTRNPWFQQLSQVTGVYRCSGPGCDRLACGSRSGILFAQVGKSSAAILNDAGFCEGTQVRDREGVEYALESVFVGPRAQSCLKQIAGTYPPRTTGIGEPSVNDSTGVELVDPSVSGHL